MQQVQVQAVKPYPTILLVDDDESILVAQRRWMSRVWPSGRFLTAEDPSSAIAALASEDVDAVVLELEYRGTTQTGVDVMAWVRAQRPGLEHRVLFLTTRPDLVPPNTPNVAGKGRLADLHALRSRLIALLPW